MGTTKFQDYLYGADFTVVTDSNALTYVITSAKIDATSYRLLSSLSAYNFEIQYRAGAQNQDADGLSLCPNGEPSDNSEFKKEQERMWQFTLRHFADLESSTKIILPEVVKAICKKHQVGQCLDSQLFPITLIETLSMNAKFLPPGIEKEETHSLQEMPHLSVEYLIMTQQTDPEIREVIYCLESKNKPANLKFHSPAENPWMREWNRLALNNGLLLRKRIDRGKTTNQLALPKKCCVHRKTQSQRAG